MVVGEHKVNNIREQNKQAKAFIKRWENKEMKGKIFFVRKRKEEQS